MQSEKLKPFDWQESIDSMPEGKFKEREQRLYDLNQKIENASLDMNVLYMSAKCYYWGLNFK